MSLMEEKYKYSIDTNIHFTYKADADMKSLCQGDVLNITEELAEGMGSIGILWFYLKVVI